MDTSRIIRNNASFLQHTVAIVPLALEIGCCLCSLFQNRVDVTEQLKETGGACVDFLQKKEDESTREYCLRVAKPIAITAVAIAAIGGAISSAFICLPSLFAIPIAIAVISYSAKVLVYRAELKESLLSAKNFAVDAFTPRASESSREATIRIFRNACITALGIGAIAAAATVAATTIAPLAALPVAALTCVLLVKGVVHRHDLATAFVPQEDESRADAARRIGKNFAVLLLAGSAVVMAAIIIPEIAPQIAELTGNDAWPKLTGSTMMVAAEYMILGVAHFAKAIYEGGKGNRKAVVFHLINGLLAFGLPMLRIYNGESLRLHHDFTGLLLALAPYRPAQGLGVLYTADSMINHIESQRGSYDFGNIMVENLWAIVVCASVASGVQALSCMLSKTKKNSRQDAVAEG